MSDGETICFSYIFFIVPMGNLIRKKKKKKSPTKQKDIRQQTGCKASMKISKVQNNEITAPKTHKKYTE